MYEKRIADPQLIVSLKIDKEAEMERVTSVQEELRKADALTRQILLKIWKWVLDCTTWDMILMHS